MKKVLSFVLLTLLLLSSLTFAATDRNQDNDRRKSGGSSDRGQTVQDTRDSRGD
jgi:hypothetical protein